MPKTRIELLIEIAQDLKDNVRGDITPALLRSFLTNQLAALTLTAEMSGGIAAYPGYVTGLGASSPAYFGKNAVAGNFTTAVPGANSIHYNPFLLTQTVTWTAIGIKVQTAAASSHIRLGICSADPVTGKPSDFILDAGEVDSSTIGVKEITINIELAPGWYYLTSNCDSGAVQVYGWDKFTTFPTPILGIPLTGIGSNSVFAQFVQSFAYAPFPATATPGNVSSGDIMGVWLRAP